MVKKIKSFTVDGDAYDLLVRLFKAAGVEVSVSMFVNNCLEELSNILSSVDKLRTQSKEYTVPMSFIIRSIVKDNEILGIGKDIPYDWEDKYELVLHGWQEEYEAQQQKIPVEFIPLLKGGLYSLSSNKRYLIEKKTGKRYISGGRGSLIAVDKTEGISNVVKETTGKTRRK
jgi:hypothetical protein